MIPSSSFRYGVKSTRGPAARLGRSLKGRVQRKSYREIVWTSEKSGSPQQLHPTS